MNELHKKWNLLSANKKIAAALMLSAFLLALGHEMRSKSHSSHGPHIQKNRESISTFIPHDHSLVPIEIINSQGLDSILGSFGIVDLFSPNQNKLIMKNVRLLQSPTDPSQWAALVRSDWVKDLLSQGAQFFVVAKNQSHRKTETSGQPRQRRKISYEE